MHDVRPLPLRLAPPALRGAMWARWYHHRAAEWAPLFQGTPLQFAPGLAMDLVPGDVISSCIAFTGFWELHLSRHLLRLARKGGTMIDVGANLGYFSLLWAAAKAGNQSIAFEASSRTSKLLLHNVRKNKMESQVHVHAVAAGRERGRLQFDPGPADQTGWGGFTTSPQAATLTVDVVRVDSVTPKDVRVALLKVDIEGADAWAIMGCDELLRGRRVECLWFEQNRERMRDLGIDERAAPEYLRSVGYEAKPRSDPRGSVVDWLAYPVRA